MNPLRRQIAAVIYALLLLGGVRSSADPSSQLATTIYGDRLIPVLPPLRNCELGKNCVFVDVRDDELYYLHANGTLIDLSGGGGGGGGGVSSVATGTGLTGGPITSNGTISIASTGVTAGSYTNPSLTINAQGQVTSATSGAATVPATRSIFAGTGLTGGGNLSIDRTLSLANTTVTPGSYTLANITVDAQGRITAAANGSAGTGTVTNVGTGTGLIGGPITDSGVISLANTAVSPGTYHLSTITVDAQGRITAASDGSAGTVTNIATGTGLTGGPITGSGTISIANTGVSAGSYLNANLTVNAQGQLTAASSGSYYTVADEGTAQTRRATLNFTGAGVSCADNAGAGRTDCTIPNTGTVTSISAGTGLTATPSPITSVGTLKLSDTGVTAGTYTAPTLTLNAQGQVTAAANGAGGLISGLTTGRLTVATSATSIGDSGFIASGNALDVASGVMSIGTGATSAGVNLGRDGTYTTVNARWINFSNGSLRLKDSTVSSGGPSLGFDATTNNDGTNGGHNWVMWSSGVSAGFHASPIGSFVLFDATAARYRLTIMGNGNTVFGQNPSDTGGVYFWVQGDGKFDSDLTINSRKLSPNYTAPTNGQALAWSSTASAYIPQSLPAGTVTSITAGTGLTATPNPITGAGTISDANTGVTAGTYPRATVTVNAQGRVTAASSDTSGGISGLTSGRIPVATGATSLGNSSFTASGFSFDVASATELDIGVNNATSIYVGGASATSSYFRSQSPTLLSMAAANGGYPNTNTVNTFTSGAPIFGVSNHGTLMAYVDSGGAYYSSNGFFDRSALGNMYVGANSGKVIQVGNVGVTDNIYLEAKAPILLGTDVANGSCPYSNTVNAFTSGNAVFKIFNGGALVNYFDNGGAIWSGNGYIDRITDGNMQIGASHGTQITLGKSGTNVLPAVDGLEYLGLPTARWAEMHAAIMRGTVIDSESSGTPLVIGTQYQTALTMGRTAAPTTIAASYIAHNAAKISRNIQIVTDADVPTVTAPIVLIRGLTADRVVTLPLANSAGGKAIELVIACESGCSELKGVYVKASGSDVIQYIGRPYPGTVSLNQGNYAITVYSDGVSDWFW